jgi:hypothetical protein
MLIFVVLLILLHTAPQVACTTDGSGRSQIPLRGDYLGQDAPTSAPALFAPGVVSTCREHSAALFTPDGEELYFGRMFPAAIYFMQQVDGEWSVPRVAPFSGEFIDLYPYLSPDGERIFFSSNRPVDERGTPLERPHRHLWMVERAGTGWSEPKHLGAVVNSGIRQGSPAVTLDGTLYFSRRDSSHFGNSTDILRSRPSDGEYVTVENVGDVINSNSPDHSPYIAPDESYIIFSSFRGGYGMSDLFISFRRSDGLWSQPRNMGARINSPAKEEYPHVTHDGKYLFFNSNRPSRLNRNKIPDGPGNIYWVDAGIIGELKPDDSNGSAAAWTSSVFE